jgi:hypothetical protein
MKFQPHYDRLKDALGRLDWQVSYNLGNNPCIVRELLDTVAAAANDVRLSAASEIEGLGQQVWLATGPPKSCGCGLCQQIDSLKATVKEQDRQLREFRTDRIADRCKISKLEREAAERVREVAHERFLRTTAIHAVTELEQQVNGQTQCIADLNRRNETSWASAKRFAAELARLEDSPFGRVIRGLAPGRHLIDVLVA